MYVCESERGTSPPLGDLEHTEPWIAAAPRSVYKPEMRAAAVRLLLVIKLVQLNEALSDPLA